MPQQEEGIVLTPEQFERLYGRQDDSEVLTPEQFQQRYNVDPVTSGLTSARSATRSFITETLPEFAREEGPSIAGAATGVGMGSAFGPAGAALGGMLGGMFGKAGSIAARGTPTPPVEAVRDVSTAGLYSLGQEMRGPVSAISRYKPPVPMTAAERSGSAALGKLEGVVERSLPAGGHFQRFRQLQQDILTGKFADDVVSRISPFRGTAEELGLRVNKALEESRKRISSEISNMYGEIDQAVRVTRVRRPTGTRAVDTGLVDESGKPITRPQTQYREQLQGAALVDTKPLKEVAIDLLKKIKEESTLIPPDELRRSTTLLNRIAKSPRRVSFKGAQAARSTLLSISRDITDPVPGKAGGIAKKISGEVDDAMMDAARKSGNPELETMVREANAAWREFTTTYNDSVVKSIIEAAPENAHNLLRTASLGDIRRARSVLPAETFQDMKAKIITDIIDESTQGELSSQLMSQIQNTMGMPGAAGGITMDITLDGKKFMNKLERLGPEKMRVLFGPAETEKIMELANISSRIKGKDQGSWLSAALNGYLIYRGVGALRGDMTALSEGASLALGTYVVGRLLTSQAGINLAVDLAKATRSKNAQRIAVSTARMLKYLEDQDQPELAPGTTATAEVESGLQIPQLSTTQ